MGRQPRISIKNGIYHVLNRANKKEKIFHTAKDYEAFEKILKEAQTKHPIRILAYCLMPNHWHLVLQPYHDGDLQKFMQWLNLTHTQRWHAYHQSVGFGHLYQGRYKSSFVQNDTYFLTLCRYVERNALRAGLVTSAQDWRWSSLWIRKYGTSMQKMLLSQWPIKLPENYISWVNNILPHEDKENEKIRSSIHKGRPYEGRRCQTPVPDTL